MTTVVGKYLEGPEATRALGRRIGAAAEAGALILLTGDVGAGKTTLAQGVAEGMGVKERVTSPTFVRVREHAVHGDRARARGLIHVDLYRVEAAGEVEALALGEYLDDGWMILVEWPDRAPSLHVVDALRITLASDGEGRRADVAGRGAWAEVVAAALG